MDIGGRCGTDALEGGTGWGREGEVLRAAVLGEGAGKGKVSELLSKEKETAELSQKPTGNPVYPAQSKCLPLLLLIFSLKKYSLIHSLAGVIEQQAEHLLDTWLTQVQSPESCMVLRASPKVIPVQRAQSIPGYSGMAQEKQRQRENETCLNAACSYQEVETELWAIKYKFGPS